MGTSILEDVMQGGRGHVASGCFALCGTTQSDISCLPRCTACISTPPRSREISIRPRERDEVSVCISPASSKSQFSCEQKGPGIITGTFVSSESCRSRLVCFKDNPKACRNKLISGGKATFS